MKKNIEKIYGEYRIPPWLAMHMYRVAAVGQAVFDARASIDTTLTPENKKDLITACLLHDMGNIIKFDLDKLPSPVRTERDHWETVRSDMISRYGRDEHQATLVIIDEIGASQRARDIVDAIGFLNNENTARSSDIVKKMAAYADSRVVPSGVATLAERMTDMHERYSDKHHKDAPETVINSKALFDIERELFAGTTLRPEDITETSMADMRDEFKRFDIDSTVG